MQHYETANDSLDLRVLDEESQHPTAGSLRENQTTKQQHYFPILQISIRLGFRVLDKESQGTTLTTLRESQTIKQKRYSPIFVSSIFSRSVKASCGFKSA